jgi:hypothetical protein
VLHILAKWRLPLKKPAVMISPHSDHSCRLEQRSTSIRVAGAINNVAYTNKLVERLSLEEADKVRQALVAGVNVTDHADPSKIVV